MKNHLLMSLFAIFITTIVYSQNTNKLPIATTAIKTELNSFLEGKWQGESDTKAEYGNVNDHNNGTTSKVEAHQILTLEFSKVNNSDEQSLNYKFDLIDKKYDSQMTSSFKAKYIIIDKSTFKFSWNDGSSVICKLNKDGIFIKKFNLQLKKTIE